MKVMKIGFDSSAVLNVQIKDGMLEEYSKALDSGKKIKLDNGVIDSKKIEFIIIVDK